MRPMGPWRGVVGALGVLAFDHITVDLTAHRDGTLAVVETIAYDFGVVPRHGIIRVIPDRVRFDAHHDRRLLITVTSVTASSGTPSGHSDSQQGSSLQIKIGDKNRTITGPHTYVIAYTVAGAFNAFPDHDELNWNAVGTEWSVPISEVTVRVHAPARVTRVGCEAGYLNSRIPCTSAEIVKATGARFGEGLLNPNQGVTVVVAMPPGTITNVAPILTKHWTLDQGFVVTRDRMGAVVALAVLLIGAILILAWRVGRDRRYVGSATDAVFGNPTGASTMVRVFDDHTTPVEYTPPDGLRPG
jgi:hypothetical protein